MLFNHQYKHQCARDTTHKVGGSEPIDIDVDCECGCACHAESIVGGEATEGPTSRRWSRFIHDEGMP